MSAIASMLAFWWLAEYSVLSLSDMIGTMVVVYLFGMYLTAAHAEKANKKEKKRLKKMKREEAINVFEQVTPLMDEIQKILRGSQDGGKYNFSLSTTYKEISCVLDDGYRCECVSFADKPYRVEVTKTFGLKSGGDGNA